MTIFPEISRKKLLIIATSCMMSAVPAFTQEAGSIETNSMTEESGEDLDLGALFDLNMEVTVASKHAEKISDAPGMIVAYSDKDIKKLGYYNLKDLADQTTGYSSYYVYGERVLESRGQKAGSFNNNKHLLLVDGIPVHNARNYKAPIEEVSLLGAQRVEFLKGPGSALYGTGAFYGVINVVPKTLSENGSWSKAMITYSNEDVSKRVMATSVIKKDAGVFNITASYFDKEASETNTMTVELDAEGNHSYNGFEGGDTTDMNQLDYDDQNSQFVNVSYKLEEGGLEGLGVGFIYTRKSGGMGEGWGGPSHVLNSLLWESTIPYVKYQKTFTDNFSFNSYVKGNYSKEEGAVPGYNYVSQVLNFETLIEGSWDLGNAGTLISGFNYDIRKELEKDGNWAGFSDVAASPFSIDGTGDSLGINYNITNFEPFLLFHTVSAYAQYQIQFPVLAGLKLTAGIRNDNGVSTETSEMYNPVTGERIERGGSFSRVAPRAGIVQKFSDKINAKVLYGTALRSPGIKEIGLNAEARRTMGKIKGRAKVEDVTAEVINTIEGSIGLTLPKVNASVAGYYNVTSDALDGYRLTINYAGGDSVVNAFRNSENEIKGGGIELDVSAMPVKQLKIIAGGSYGKTYSVGQDSTGAETKSQQYGVPTGKINGAIAYKHDSGFKFGITPIFRYYMGYRLNGDAELSDRDLKNKHMITDGYGILDLNVELPVNENFGFEVMGRNLTNTEFYQPGGNGIDAQNPKIKGPSVAFSVVGQF